MAPKRKVNEFLEENPETTLASSKQFKRLKIMEPVFRSPFEFFSSFIVEKKRPARGDAFCSRYRFSLSDRKKFLLLRWGKYINVNMPIMTIKDIQCIVGGPYSSISKVLRRYRTEGIIFKPR